MILRILSMKIMVYIFCCDRDDDSEAGNEILTITKDCLLQGLSDSDLANK